MNKMPQALLAVVWRRKPKPGLLLHSDQGCRFTSGEWQNFLKAHRTDGSASRPRSAPHTARCEVRFDRFVRHPLMLGFVIAFWATLFMSQGNLMFRALTSAHIVVGVQLGKSSYKLSFRKGRPAIRAAAA